MTLDELLADRTAEPALTDEQFARALLLAVAEAQAEKFVHRRRRRGRPAKSRELSDNAVGMLTVEDACALWAEG